MSPEHQGCPFCGEKAVCPLHKIKVVLLENGQADLDL